MSSICLSFFSSSSSKRRLEFWTFNIANLRERICRFKRLIVQRGVLEDVEYLAEDLVWVPKDLFKIFEAEGELNVPGMPIELNFLLTPETLDAGLPGEPWQRQR